MSDDLSSVSEELRQAVGPILGRTPSGVFILTAADGQGRETGMLASWVQQASFEPPVVTVAVNCKRYLIEWLEAQPRLALSFVGESQKELLRHFGRGFEPDVPAFEGLEISRDGATGLPVLADSLGWLEGEISGRLEAGDHVIYSVTVTGGASGPRLESEAPMVHLRRSGFTY
ncbi:MAG: flavin reductase family protein [Planctomycetaceae bacterium]|nr:flavin reductase family protein [Planctomycetaceae bacterium]